MFQVCQNVDPGSASTAFWAKWVRFSDEAWAEANAKVSGGGADWAVRPTADLGWRHARVVARVGDQPWGVPRLREKRLPPTVLFRRMVTIPAGVRRARLRVTALGICRVTIDGQAVTDARLLPGWTDYRRRVYEREFDVTAWLGPSGPHAMGVELADGWYAGYLAMNVGRDFYGDRPKACLTLTLEHEDGSATRIDTDRDWQCRLSGVLEADLFNGFHLDLTRHPEGWDRPGADPTGWLPAAEVTDGLPPRVLPHPAAPVREVDTVSPRSLREVRPGVWQIDFGQNLVGVVRFRIHEPARRVTIIHAEMLNPDDSLYTTALRGARNRDTFENITAGEWIPRFTFHGFRYAELTGLPQPPTVDDIKAVVIGSDLEQTGWFDCHDTQLNQLWKNTWWSQRGNFIDLPTDCPQRDERAGWTGDAQVFLPTAAYNMDVADFFEKWLTDVEDAQREDGAFSDIAPNMVAESDPERFGNAGWGDAGILCPHRLWWVYGDLSPIERRWDAMRRHFDYLVRTSDRGIRHAGVYGDWLNQDGGTDLDLVGTAYLIRCADAMAEMARAQGHDARDFANQAAESRRAFAERFIDPTQGSIHDAGVTAYALAIAFEVLEPDDRARAAEHFAQAVQQSDCRVVTGFLGTPILLPALTRIGRSDLAWRTLRGEGFPSWLFTVNLDATTMWERWDGYHPERGPGNPAMNSFNHYAYGSVVQWFYEGIAGLQPTAPGFNQIAVAPQLPPDATGPRRVDATYDSVRGRIKVRWQRTADECDLSVTLPEGVDGTVYCPWGEIHTDCPWREIHTAQTGSHRFRGPAKTAEPIEVMGTANTPADQL